MTKLPMSLIFVKLNKKRRPKLLCKRPTTKPLKPKKKCCGGRGLKLAGQGPKRPIFY